MTPIVEGRRSFSVFQLRRSGALSPGSIRPWFWRSVPTGKITRMAVLKVTASEMQVLFQHGGRWQKNVSSLCVRPAASEALARGFAARAAHVLPYSSTLAGDYCQRCLGLAYSCQQVTRRWRAIERAQAIRMRLGGSANVLEPFPARPRYMRRKRYECLRERALLLQAEGLEVLDRSLNSETRLHSYRAQLTGASSEFRLHVTRTCMNRNLRASDDKNLGIFVVSPADLDDMGD